MTGIQISFGYIYSQFKKIIRGKSKSKSYELAPKIIFKNAVQDANANTSHVIDKQWIQVEATNLLWLSRDVLKEIFFYLNTEEVCKLSRVSKTWYEIAQSNDIWEKLCQKEGIAVPSNVKDLNSVKNRYFEQTEIFFPSYVKSPLPVEHERRPIPCEHLDTEFKTLYWAGDVVFMGYKEYIVVQDLKKNEIISFPINPNNEKDSLEHFEVFANIIVIKFNVNECSDSLHYGIKSFDTKGNLLYRIQGLLRQYLDFRVIDSKLVVYFCWTEKKFDASLSFFDLSSGKKLKTFGTALIQFGFDSFEDSIVSASISDVSIWSKKTGKFLGCFGNLQGLKIKEFQVNNGLAACYTYTNLIKNEFDRDLLKIWDLKTGNCIQIFDIGFGEKSRDLFKLVKGHLLVDKSTSKEIKIEILEIASKKCIKSLTAAQKNESTRLKSLQVFHNQVIAVKKDEFIVWKLNVEHIRNPSLISPTPMSQPLDKHNKKLKKR